MAAYMATRGHSVAKTTFTAGRVADFSCPQDKQQAFLWDDEQPGLGLRATAKGAKAYVFQSKLDGRDLRVTLGSPAVWTIKDARKEARRLQVLVDQGKDPRREKAARIADELAERQAARATRLREEVTGSSAWKVYCEDRKVSWSERNYKDHIAYASPGGVQRKRAIGKTEPGPLYGLLNRPLVSIDGAAVTSWVARETKTRPARALLGFRLLRAFMNWCAEHEDYAALVQKDACSTKRVRDKLPKPKAKDDALQREQLKTWFSEVRKEPNFVVSAYLQALLLTGARKEELMGLRWGDVDFQWKTLTIRDKVEGERTIPLTPYVSHLLASVPRRKEDWVFSSPTSKDKRLQDPRGAHVRALRNGALPHITLHGLRRSFGSLAEWVECPVGIVAQIQGHKPSAIAEKHYRVRPIDLLRKWHEKIEAWTLDQAGLVFDATAKEQRLRLVASK
jgi:integrase